MKLKSSALVVMGILLSLFSSSCGTYLTYEPIGEIKYGNNENELRYTHAPENVFIYNAFPDDIEADNNNNIYICEKYSSRVLKYSPQMKLLNVIELSSSLFKRDRSMCNIDLETDNDNNLYALITSEDYFVKMVKYNSSGKQVDDFNLTTAPGDLCRDFFISSKGQMFINTFPVYLTDTNNINKGLTYAYNLDGKFLGRTDYFIEDPNGFACKRNLLNTDQLEITRFITLSDTVMKTSGLKAKDTLKSDMSDRSWHFLGVDKLANIFFSQGTDNLTIRKFDFKNKKIKVIKVNIEDFQRDGIVFKNREHTICMSPAGDLYVCGIKTALPLISEHIAVTNPSSLSNLKLKDLSVVVIKFPQE